MCTESSEGARPHFSGDAKEHLESYLRDDVRCICKAATLADLCLGEEFIDQPHPNVVTPAACWGRRWCTTGKQKVSVELRTSFRAARLWHLLPHSPSKVV